MRVALCSDEDYPVNHRVGRELEARGHQVVPFGSVATGREAPWALAAEQAAVAVARGECDEGIFFCWSGTGICMSANKVPGIRAALCTDAATAQAAREWNHANVLCLSNRQLSEDVAVEILGAWLSSTPSQRGREGVALLAAVDGRQRTSS